MSGGGGGGNTQTIQKADPWKELQPYLKTLFQKSGEWLESPNPQYFPESTVGAQAPETLAAQEAAVQRAMMGSPLQQGAQGQVYNTMMGGYLGNNPFLEATYRAASDPLIEQYSRAIEPGITSRFAAGGRYGSGAHTSAISDATGRLGQALGGLGAQIYGPAYENERARQMQALGMAPGLAQMDYNDISQLANVGTAREGRAQELVNADISRWDFGQNQPLSKLQAFSQLLQGGTPFSKTTTSSQGPGSGGFNLGGALGGAMTGAQLSGAAGAFMPAFQLAGGTTGAMGSGLAAGLGAMGPLGWGALLAGGLLGSGVL